MILNLLLTVSLGLSRVIKKSMVSLIVTQPVTLAEAYKKSVAISSSKSTEWCLEHHYLIGLVFRILFSGKLDTRIRKRSNRNAINERDNRKSNSNFLVHKTLTNHLEFSRYKTIPKPKTSSKKPMCLQGSQVNSSKKIIN
jgi:hypothetical protein